MRSLLCAITLLLPATIQSNAALVYVDLGVGANPVRIVDTRDGHLVLNSAFSEETEKTDVRLWTLDATGKIVDTWVPSSTATYAHDVNSLGTVVGTDADGSTFVCRYKGAYTKIGNSSTLARGINEAQVVVGSTSGINPYRSTPLPTNPAKYDIELMKWDSLAIGQVYPRGTVQGVYADQYSLLDVNERGTYLGNYHKAGLTGGYAFSMDASFSGVNGISGFSSAAAINDNDCIAGRSSIEPEAMWKCLNGTSALLGFISPGISSSAAGLNNANQVVGTSDVSGQPSGLVDPSRNRAFLWTAATGMQDLDVLVRQRVPLPKQLLLVYANAISQSGSIAGNWYDNTTKASGGFVLITTDLVDDLA